MFVAAYDDRAFVPEYFAPFIANTTRYCDLHLIGQGRNCRRSGKAQSKFDLRIIDPNTLFGFVESRQLFDEVFVNYSTNSSKFERACFLRWFALNAATNTLSDDEFICLLDTDFLIGMSPEKLLARCKTENKHIQFVGEWIGDRAISVGPEITIMSKKYLFDFCEYLIGTFYAGPMRESLLKLYFARIGKGQAGGICDMIALAAFSRLHNEISFNLRKLGDPAIVDNFNQFKMENNGDNQGWEFLLRPNGSSLHIGDTVRQLVGVHFQGTAKKLMHPVMAADGRLTRETCGIYLTQENAWARKLSLKIKREFKRIVSFIAR